ncbi:uncharacterized protein LOC114317256 [Camellia sinensis]|uniref:uncharacterized protein LOC114317256 n=1 Tax=Camellia sinensis TaxID=4442 RepID=UPI0010363FD0|nr:uncharacterized protein LOC114317256 [Camellia sinensis]
MILLILSNQLLSLVWCDDEAVLIRVEYQGLPAICQHCQIFGHEIAKCVSTQVAHLISLQKNTEEQTTELVDEWTTVTAKGKRKVGEPEPVLSPILEEETNPINMIVELAPNPVVEEAPQPYQAVVDLSEGSEEINAVMDPAKEMDKFTEKVLEITKLVIPQTAEHMESVIAEVKLAREIKKASTHQVANQMSGKSSGKGTSSQRRKKRGLNDPSKHKEIKNLVLNENINVMGVLETKIKQITELATNDVFFATFVYAENKHNLRLPLFESLAQISRAKSKSPSIFLGDFNATRIRQEKVEGSSNWSSEHEAFNTCINESELAELSYGGCQFTWSNKRCGGEYIATKIDRVLINEAWLDKFPESTAFFLPSGVSDHSPAMVNTSIAKTSFKKPFKFFDCWSKHPEFISTVSSSWNQYIRGVPMFRVYQKLRQLKVKLKLLNKKDFSDISLRVQASKTNLDLLQFKLDKDPLNCVLQGQEREEHKKYLDLRQVEESLALQKSRIQWLGLGDKNSSFFFRTVKSNINRGKILSVDMGNGLRSTESGDIHSAFIQYFTNLFGSPFEDEYQIPKR